MPNSFAIGRRSTPTLEIRKYCKYQRELIDNLRTAVELFKDKYGNGRFKRFMNTTYGILVTSNGTMNRSLFTMAKMLHIDLFSKEPISMDYVSEYECMIVIDFMMCWFLTPEDHIHIIRTTPKLEDLLKGLTSKWEHGPYTMYDKTVAPLGFNDKGYPTPPCLDVLTRQKRKRKENDDDIDR